MESLSLRLFLDLPIEIVQQILSNLEPSDLLSLRKTNHAFHHLVHQHEERLSSIFYNRLWSRHNLNNEISVPPVIPDYNTLFNIYRQHNAIDLVAGTLAYHITKDCKPRHGSISIRIERQKWREKLASKLAAELTLPLMILQVFLTKISAVFRHGDVQFRHLTTEEYLNMYDIYALDQQKIIQGFNLSTRCIQAVNHAWLILCGVMSSHGMSLDDHESATSQKILLIVEGLFLLRRVLDCESTQSRIWTLHDAGKAIQARMYWRPPKIRSEDKIPTIHHVGPPKGAYRWPKFLTRGLSTHKQFWAQQDVWLKAANAELLRRLGRASDNLDTRSWIENVLCKDEPRGVRMAV